MAWLAIESPRQKSTNFSKKRTPQWPISYWTFLASRSSCYNTRKVGTMRIASLLHAAVLVPNLDQAKRFYGGLLGLKEKPRPDFDFPGAWYDLGDCELHLMVTLEALPPAARRPRRDYHISLEVDDLDAAKRAFEEAGLPTRESSSGRGSIFVRDPDGNLI